MTHPIKTQLILNRLISYYLHLNIENLIDGAYKWPANAKKLK